MNPQDRNAPFQGGPPDQGQPQPYGQPPPGGYPQQPGGYPPQPYPAAQQPPAKKRSIPPWLVLAVVAIGIGSRFLGGGATMTCDSRDVATTVLDIINKQYAARHATFKATGLSQAATLGSANGVTRCSATASFNDGDTLRLFYTLSGERVDVQATQPGAGAVAGGGGAGNSKSTT